MDAAYTGSQIAARRKALSMTQKDLAGKLHVTDKAVSKWERGINFPDLGLIESLAAALDTTPAQLLGLEEASRDEIVNSMTQISGEQLENAQRDVKWMGWGSILVAAMLTIAYMLFGNDVRRTQNAYLILHCVIIAMIIGGIYLLVKYGQIKKFKIADTLTLYAAAAPMLIYLGISFFTGYGPHPVLGLCLIAAAACLVQLLFCRIMRPQPAKALPLILSTAFAAWHLWSSNLAAEFIIPAVCCLVVWLVCYLKNRKKEPVR